MNIKKAIMPLGVITVIGTAVLSAVSCSAESKAYKSKEDYTKIDWAHLKHFDATLIKWIDGDTATIKFNDMNTGVLKTQSIRVEFIDTPESHLLKDGNWEDTTGPEKIYADKATKFGQSQIPDGSKIRVASNGAETYGRIVGAIFYGDDYDKSYEEQILAAGLAMPFITNSGLSLKMRNNYDPLHYLGYPLAEAYQHAKTTKQGLFKENLETILKIHGSTDTSAVEHLTDGRKSIYNYLKLDAWNE